jgi:hypothetical protein
MRRQTNTYRLSAVTVRWANLLDLKCIISKKVKLDTIELEHHLSLSRRASRWGTWLGSSRTGIETGIHPHSGTPPCEETPRHCIGYDVLYRSQIFASSV